ncbi:Protein lev-9 [Araneus ventricosus]|uniref:Protein lev-9 n=1 Tax=Araneus ventricosus TaxID=182803 RepID=A0A4Y2CH04_ARAVE|nr:Protein lev-9 [Araneus ventricosus]
MESGCLALTRKYQHLHFAKPIRKRFRLLPGNGIYRDLHVNLRLRSQEHSVYPAKRHRCHCIVESRWKSRSCGDPGEVKNARREGEIFTFTSRVTYHCDPGYELVGRANRYCESKGEWSGVLPSCRPVECPIPRDVPSGRAVYTTTTYQSVARYECLNGYRLVGPEIRVCEANKQWEGEEPYCEGKCRTVCRAVRASKQLDAWVNGSTLI